jgi:tRNA-dihydrouridine synthase 4
MTMNRLLQDQSSLYSIQTFAEWYTIGIMSARGLLENPALFAGYSSTPPEAVDKFMGYVMRCPLPYHLVLHHLSEMTGNLLSKRQKVEMLESRDILELTDWLRDRDLIFSTSQTS